MELSIEKKKEFFSFIDDIKCNKKNKVGILSHNDLDGISSAIFLSLILKKKGIDVETVLFMNYNPDLIKTAKEKFKKNNINKLFISDISVDCLNLEDFLDLKNEIDVFLIDHHPKNPLLDNMKNIIKAESEDCASYVIWNLGEGLIDKEKWNFLICSTMITEFSYKKKENLQFIKNIYNDFDLDNILESDPGVMSQKLSNISIYFSKYINKTYKMILDLDFRSIDKYYSIVQQEIVRLQKEFLEHSEYYPEKNLYFFYSNPQYDIVSLVASLASMKKPDQLILFLTDDKDDKEYIRFSARNQALNLDLTNVLKRAIVGLKNANAGGHKAASGGKLLKKDIVKFKENLLREL